MKQKGLPGFEEALDVFADSSQETSKLEDHFKYRETQFVTQYSNLNGYPANKVINSKPVGCLPK